MSVLTEAQGLISGDRQAQYGSPEDTFARIEALCAASGNPRLEALEASDIAMLMVFVKLARETRRHKRDNVVDAAAYLEIFERLVEHEEALERCVLKLLDAPERDAADYDRSLDAMVWEV